jgi:hypothetical protein
MDLSGWVTTMLNTTVVKVLWDALWQIRRKVEKVQS